MKKLASDLRNYVALTKQGSFSRAILGKPWAKSEVIRGIPSNFRVNREMLTRLLGALAGGAVGATGASVVTLPADIASDTGGLPTALAAAAGGLGGAALGSRGAGAARHLVDTYRKTRGKVVGLDHLDPAIVDESIGGWAALGLHARQLANQLGSAVPR